MLSIETAVLLRGKQQGTTVSLRIVGLDRTTGDLLDFELAELDSGMPVDAAEALYLGDKKCDSLGRTDLN